MPNPKSQISPRRRRHLRGLEDLRTAQEERADQRSSGDAPHQREQDGRGSDPGRVPKGAVPGTKLRQRAPRPRELEEDPLRHHHPALVNSQARGQVVTF